MNPRTYNDDSDYYALDPRWFFANQHVFIRIFQLERNLETIKNCLRDMAEIRDEAQQEGVQNIGRKRRSELKISIRDLMEAAEVFEYCFSELNESLWFGTFTQDIAHAYWRIEDGKFSDIRRDDEQFSSLVGEAERILRHTSDSQGVFNRLDQFIEYHAFEIHPNDVDEEYQPDVFEAKDLYCLGYYSTALLVMGRAVEKALLELGEMRNVNSVEVYGQERLWESTKFAFRVNALREINLPGRHGKMLTKREFHLASILVDYRNNVAHSEYESIERDAAERQIMDALDLLRSISERMEYLDSYEGDIPTVNRQSAQ